MNWSIFSSWAAFISMLEKAPPHLLIPGGVLAVLTLGSVVLFFVPGIVLRIRLWRMIRKLRAQRKRDKADSQKDLRKDLQAIFQGDRKFAHLWKEFRDTLHEQKGERDGQTVVLRLRATVPAESFFNSQYLVDGRLRTEFFKHLPGIFTGIGIIGTFLGLLMGLQAFQVSEDAGTVRTSLEALLHGVYDAFFVSAAAIALAMLVTFFEKLLIASLYRCTETIAQLLDSLFDAGAGEEYLSRLVAASEDSASQSKILKDSLVGDLKVILQEMSERQIAAQAAQNKVLGEQIASSIRTGLKDPLEQIGVLVEKASGDQSSAASDMLKDVMASFSQRLNELFGGQISGLQDLNQKSAQAMQDVVVALNQMVGNMEGASQRSGDAMSERLSAALEDMGRRQADINDQTKNVVEQIRRMVSATQEESSGKLQGLLADLGRQVSDVVGALQSQSKVASDEQQRREQAFASRTEGMVATLGDSVSAVVKQMAESTDQMQKSIAALERTTESSIDKLSSGARTLEQGAVSFAKAGEGVSGALTLASTVANKMTEVSTSLTTSATSLQTVFADYRANRDATTSMLSEVRAVIEVAKREAGMTEMAVDQIQNAALKLAEVQKQTDDYLAGISSLLAGAHESFADGITRTLERANSEFHTKLSTAVSLLSSAIEELEITVSGAVPAR